MADSRYIAELQKAIHQQHGCQATHWQSIPVQLGDEDQFRWQGVVEVFKLIGHVKAQWCYAWSSSSDAAQLPARTFAVLHLPPIVSPRWAVESVAAAGPARSRFPTRAHATRDASATGKR